MTVRKPNFFLLGAPKCGTTSLANWLGEQPQVFLTDQPKEPKFFDRDVSPNLMSEAEYARLFKAAGSQHKAVGEASTTYLRSQVAVPSVLEYAESPKFIVCLRSPVDMAVSVHGQLLHTLYEDIEDFKEAWSAQIDRARGLRIPVECKGEEERLQYGNVCRLGEQLERLYQHVEKEQVFVVFLEDLKKDPRTVYRKILSFLELDDDGRSDFPAANARKKPRHKWISYLFRKLGRLKTALGLGGKHFGLLRSAHAWNKVPAKKVEINEHLREELVDYFREDILLLSRQTNRDLSHWLK